METGSKPNATTTVVDSIVETEYEPCACTPMGKMKRVSQPRKPTDPVIWTTYTYDELGRTKTVTHPPNTGTTGISGTTTYEYVANRVKIIDPAGRWKEYTMDGFGNLTSVKEPKPTSGDYITNYTYTPFSQLSTVTMTRDGYSGHTVAPTVTQTRTFTYNGYGQLATTNFPETKNGVTTYTHNMDGTVSTKLDYKGVRKYFYGAGGRLERYPGATSVAGATNEDVTGRVNYYYDGVPGSIVTDFQGTYKQGRLAAIAYNSNTYELYSYTIGGKLKKKRLQAPYGTLEVSFEHDTEGKLQYMVYPSGKRVKYTYDDLRRHTGLKDVQGTTETDLVNNLTYGASGELKTMSWYSPTMQLSTQTWTYNNRLQMTNYTHAGVGGPVNQEYKYSTLENDGKLWRKKDHVSGEEVEYQYDTIHRLKTAAVLAGSVAPAQEWGQTYNYDGFGNMKQKLAVGVAASTAFNISLTSANNNAPAAGDPGDIDNRITSTAGHTYAYAPDNKRILKIIPASDARYATLWVGQMRIGTYRFMPGAPGNPYFLAQVMKEDFYVAGRRVAPSDRLASDLSGGVRLMPYGEEIGTPVAHDRTKFATYHRDETGWDYADQRYYSPGSGRFMSVDQGPPSSKKPSSWNRYAYSWGDPINMNDVDGMRPNKIDTSGWAGSTTVSWWTGANGDSTHNTQILFFASMFDPGNQYAGAFDLQTFINDRRQQREAADLTLQTAKERALAALKKKECQELFGTEQSRAAGWDPVRALETIYSAKGGYIGGTGAYVGYKIFNNSPGMAATGPAVFVGGNTGGVAVGVRVDINAGAWNDLGSVKQLDIGPTEQAATLLHEMGHVYDALALSGSGGSAMNFDGISEAVSHANQTLILEKCFGIE